MPNPFVFDISEEELKQKKPTFSFSQAGISPTPGPSTLSGLPIEAPVFEPFTEEDVKQEIAAEKEAEARQAAIREKYKNWYDTSNNLVRQYYTDWKEEWKQKEGEYPDDFDYLETISLLRDGIAPKKILDKLNFLSENVTERNRVLNRIFGKRKLVEAVTGENGFIKYFVDKNKERINKLSQEELFEELKNGGIYASITPQGMQGEIEDAMGTIIRSIADVLSFGILSDQDPVYGNKLNESRPVSYTAGSLMGHILSTMALSEFANVIGLPEKLARIGTKGGKLARPVGALLRGLGLPKMYVEAKMPVLIKFLSRSTPRYAQFFAKGGAEAVGAMGATQGMIYSFRNAVRTTIARYKEEDELSPQEYNQKMKSMPRDYVESMVGGFFKGYGIGLINDPRGWSGRILGDAIYSAAQMGADVLLGNRKEWDWQAYLKDAVMGHILGEVQGVVFSPSRFMMAKALSDKRMRFYMTYLKRKGYVKTLKDAWYPAEVLYRAEQIAATKSGVAPSRTDMIRMLDQIGVHYKDNFTVYHGQKYPNLIELDRQEHVTPARDQQIDGGYRMLQDKFGVSERVIDAARQKGVVENRDVDSWIGGMKKIGKVTDKAPPPAKEPITDVEAFNRLKRVPLHKLTQIVHDALQSDPRIQPIYKDLSREDALEKTSKLFSSSPIPHPKEKAQTNIPLNPDSAKTPAADPNLNRFMVELDKNKNEIMQKLEGIEKDVPILDKELAMLQVLAKWDQDKPVIFDRTGEYKEVEDFFLTSIHKQVLDNKQDLALARGGKEPEKSDIFYIDPRDGKETIRPFKVYGIDENQPFKSSREEKYFGYLMSRIDPKRPATALQSAMLFMRYVNNMKYADIVDRLKTWGMRDISEQKVASEILSLRKSMLAEIKAADQQISPRSIFTEEQARQLFRESTADIQRDRNPITGLDKNIDPEIAALVRDKGGVYLDLWKDYNTIRNNFNQNIADKSMAQAGKIIKDLINEVNAAYQERPDTYIGVVNPEEFNSTRFLLYHKNMQDGEFVQNAHYIRTVLRDNYSNDDYAKKFSIVLRRANDDIDTIVGFKNIDAKLIQSTKEFATAKGEDVFDPNGPYRELFMEPPPWKRAAVNAGEDIYGDYSKRMEWEMRSDHENMSDRDLEDYVVQYLGQHLNMADDSVKAILEAAPYFKKNIKDQIQLNFGRAKELKKDVKDFLDTVFNIWGGFDLTEAGKTIVPEIYKVSSFPRQSEKFAKAFMTAIYTRYLKDKGVTFEQFRKTNIPMGLAIAREQYKIIDKNTSKLKTPPDRLNEPINWNDEKVKGYSLKKIDISRYKNKFISKMKLIALFELSADPLFYSKFMVQTQGISPEVLAGFYRANARAIQPAQQYLMDEVNGLTMADSHMNIAVPIQENYRKRFIEKLSEHLGEGNIERIRQLTDDFDLDNPMARKFLEQLTQSKTAIKNSQIRKDLAVTLENYYDTNPDTWSYVHQNTLGKSSNLDIYMDQRDALDQIRKGETPRGTDVASIKTPELLKRSFAHEEHAVRAGYHLKDTGYFDTVYSVVSMLKTKHMMKQWLEGLKKGSIEKFKLAQAAGRIQDYFAGEVNGWFYYPSKNEIAAKHKEIAQLTDGLGNLVQAGKLGRVRRYQQKIAELTQFVNGMEDLRKAWNGPDGVKLMELATMGEERYLPLNKYDFYDDEMPFYMKPGKDKMTGKSLGQGIIKTRIPEKQLISRGVAGGEGLYFNEWIYRGMNQFIFRDNYLKGSRFKVINKFMKHVFDPLNTTLKIIGLVKPTIMWANGLTQGQLSHPLFMSKIPKGIEDYRKRNEKGTWQNWFYNQMDQREVFNRAVETPDIYSDCFAATHEAFNKSPFVGKIMEDLTGSKNIVKNMYRSGRDLFRGLQSVTWAGDEINRLTLAEQWFPVFLRTATGSKGTVDQIMAKATKAQVNEALNQTAERVNHSMVHYSRVPNNYRQMFNRAMVFPTFLIGTARMYKDNFKSIATGIGRIFGDEISAEKYKLFGKEIRSKYKYSDDPRIQSLYEILPAFNNILMQTAFKLPLMIMGGWGVDSLMDAITGYRLKKEKGTGYMDREIQYLSLSTPVMFLNKWWTRKRAPRVLLRYNIARFPGLIYSWLNNQNLVTGAPIYTVDPFSSPENFAIALRQMGLDFAKTYFPLGGDISSWLDDESDIFEKMMNFTGVAFTYGSGSRGEFLREFRAATDRTSDPAELLRAQRKFYKKMQTLHFKTLGRPGIFWNEVLQESRDNINNFYRFNRQK